MKPPIDYDKIQEKYTAVEKRGDHYSTSLKVENQSFCVCENTDKTHAQWYARMLATALQVLIRNETNGGKDESTSR